MVRWFHRDVSGLQAEEMLKSRGVHGSFLARPSKKNVGDFSLSVRVGDQVTHIRIQNTGDYYDLYGGEKFATLSELVQFYTADNGVLQDKDGTTIELLYPLNSCDPTTERWYHGHLSGPSAEKLLCSRDEPGTFLVRESLSKPGDFVLSALTDEKNKSGVKRVSHFKIICKDSRYTVGGSESFSSLSDLVDFYKRKGIEEVSGYWVHLSQPFFSTRVNAADIDSRVRLLDQTKELQQDGSETSKAGFWEEFDTLQKMEAKVTKSRDEGQRPENKTKNRYKNILPFNDTRVVLFNSDPDIVGSDYINANYIRNSLREGAQKVYIATQGCLSSTVEDFWKMVWQEKSRVIVMTTRLVEKGRNKCVPYWSQEATEDLTSFTVTVQSETEEDLVRDFKVTVIDVTRRDKPGSSRSIFHFQYLSWPDHGVPQEPSGVLNFLSQVNSKQAELRDAGPMIIHCSAGIGRTGTIIVIDMIVETLDTIGMNCDLDIPKHIAMVRDQRSGMVQTEAQYKFIYLAVSEYIDTTKTKDNAAMETKFEYGNICLKQQPVSRKVSKNKEDVYENISKAKKGVKKTEKKSGSVKKK